MARIQNEYKIPKLSQAAFELTAPWEYKELNILITNDVNKKTSPETAAIEANKRIEQLKCPGTKHVYTDATRKKNGITSWAVVTEKETIDFGRLPDNTPITLAELMAIKEAIDWFQTNEKVDQHRVIHTDSMAALQTLQNIRNTEYPEASNEILRISNKLSEENRSITFHWVPSHVGIIGNELADKMAAEAADLQNVQHCEQTMGSYKQLLRNHSNELVNEQVEQIKTKETIAWYLKTTVEDNKLIEHRLIDTQLRKMRFNQYTRSY